MYIIYSVWKKVGLWLGTIYFQFWSKAIACYLCNAYASKKKKTSLYPTDLAARARVDMVLYMVDTMADKIFSYVVSFTSDFIAIAVCRSEILMGRYCQWEF